MIVAIFGVAILLVSTVLFSFDVNIDIKRFLPKSSSSSEQKTDPNIYYITNFEADNLQSFEGKKIYLGGYVQPGTNSLVDTNSNSIKIPNLSVFEGLDSNSFAIIEVDNNFEIQKIINQVKIPSQDEIKKLVEANLKLESCQGKKANKLDYFNSKQTLRTEIKSQNSSDISIKVFLEHEEVSNSLTVDLLRKNKVVDREGLFIIHCNEGGEVSLLQSIIND